MSNQAFQDQLAAARRNQILDAATKVFAEKGFHRATIRQIAREAGVADGTIYNYFENKSALFLGIFDRLNLSEERPAHFARAREMGIEAFVGWYLARRLQALNEGGLDLFQLLLAELLVNEELRHRYYEEIVAPTFVIAEESFQHWVEQGDVAPLDPALAVRSAAAMVLGMLMLRLLGDAYLQTHWEEVPDVLARFIIQGLTPTSGSDAARDDAP